MRLSLGFSPCPNDTFIFDAMVHKKIDTEGIDFEVVMEDVESLNTKAFNKQLDITKLSYHAFLYLSNDYVLLPSGSALGKGCGPLLIARQLLTEEQINGSIIAIPGQYTTANFLMRLAYPKAQNKQEMLFSDIEAAVLNNDVAAGVIIHENRFTYQQKGLIALADLGNFWESTTKLPIPLGGIAIKREIDAKIQQKIMRIMKKSIIFALSTPQSVISYVKSHAQEMSEDVMRQHISLYVNDYTLELGTDGKNAVRSMFSLAIDKGLLPQKDTNFPIFVCG